MIGSLAIYQERFIFCYALKNNVRIHHTIPVTFPSPHQVLDVIGDIAVRLIVIDTIRWRRFFAISVGAIGGMIDFSRTLDFQSA